MEHDYEKIKSKSILFFILLNEYCKDWRITKIEQIVLIINGVVDNDIKRNLN